MATITIRNLDDDLKAMLRVVAASHGQSMEEEVGGAAKTGACSSSGQLFVATGS